MSSLVLGLFRDHLRIHELSSFPEVSRSYFEPTVMFLRWEITGSTSFWQVVILESSATLYKQMRIVHSLSGYE